MDTSQLSTEQRLVLKQQIKDSCIDIIEQRIATIQQTIDNAQEAANSEDKGSAGDKYETGRAMAHLTIEMNGKQLEDARNELATINNVNTSVIHTTVVYGAVVVCKGFMVFIAAGLGNVIVNDQKIMALSTQAPIVAAMQGKRTGDPFTFNTKEQVILDVF